MNKKFLKISYSIAGATGIAIASSMAVSDKWLQFTPYTIDTGKLCEDINFLVMSDLHFSRFGKDNIKLIEKARMAEPDFILLAGDFFDIHHGKSNAELVRKTLRGLSEMCDVYFVPGNHDKRYDARTGEDFKSYVTESGCIYLDGDILDITVRKQKIRIGGIFDYGAYIEDYSGEHWNNSSTLAYLKKFDDTSMVKLLVMHRPNAFIYMKERWDIDAVFCGHNHGGVWQMPIIGGVYASEQGFFPKYDKGVFEFGKTKMYLSSGLEGFYEIPRWFMRPEILKITVK